jgi:hypothetical protein
MFRFALIAAALFGALVAAAPAACLAQEAAAPQKNALDGALAEADAALAQVDVAPMRQAVDALQELTKSHALGTPERVDLDASIARLEFRLGGLAAGEQAAKQAWSYAPGAWKARPAAAGNAYLAVSNMFLVQRFLVDAVRVANEGLTLWYERAKDDGRTTIGEPRYRALLDAAASIGVFIQCQADLDRAHMRAYATLLKKDQSAYYQRDGGRALVSEGAIRFPAQL